jgi:hypothetical protein
MTLTVTDLAQANIHKSMYNHETYKLLYAQCAEHIARKHEAGCTETIWNVPHFMVGRGLYDVTHAVRYIRDKLRLGRFDVSVHDTSVLTISWKASLRKALKKASPAKPASPPKPKAPIAKEPLVKKLKRLSRRLKTTPLK